jgi:hypothetical protein
VCCHGRKVKNLAVLSRGIGLVALFGLARMNLAENKRIRD